MLFAFAIAAGVAAQENAVVTHDYNGYQISVVSIERMKKWSVGGKAFEPKEQTQEFVVILLAVRPLEKQTSFALTRELAGVRDTNGKTYAMPLNKYGVPVVAEGTMMEVPFAVPVGTKLRSLQLGDVKFDLNGVKEKPAKAAS